MKILRALLVAAALLLPAPAQAHVKLRRSDPGAGAILTSTPLQLRFWFSEPVELTITHVTVIDASGKSFGLAEAMPIEGEQNGVQLLLFTALNAGFYTVKWQTVALDGHPASGTYTFRILGANEVIDTAFAAAASRAQRATALAEQRAEEVLKPVDVLAMRSVSPQYVVVRALSFIAQVIFIGAGAFWLLVLRPTREVDAATWKRIIERLGKQTMLAALAFLLLCCGRLFLQTQLVSGNDVPDTGDFTKMLLHTNWGIAWRTQVVAAAVAFVALLLVRMFKSVAWFVVVLMGLTTAIATSFTSHAGAGETLQAFGIIDDASHLVAVSAWLGGLFWMLSAAFPVLSASDRHSKRATSLVSAFSKVALWSVAIVVLSGVVSAWLRVGTLGNLVSTGYGQALIAKLLLVIGVGAVGYHNWRTLRPALANEGVADALRKSARTELTIAAFVILATAVLVGLPLPSGH